MHKLASKYLFFFSGKRAATTVTRVKCQLNCFVRYMNHTGSHLGQIDKEKLISWSLYLKDKLKTTTLCSYHSVVKGFMDWLYEEGYLLVNPWPKELMLKCKSYLPKAFPNINEAREYLEVMEEGAMFPNRNRAVAELAYSCGLRREELFKLDVSQIEGSWLCVLGKGNKERIVPFGAKAKSWLMNYIKSERAALVMKYNPLEEALFLNYCGNRLGLTSYNEIVKMNRPVGATWTLHSFRHACATHMLENGASVRVIQKLLGHKKLSSTQVYTRVEVSGLRDMLQEYHPRS